MQPTVQQLSSVRFEYRQIRHYLLRVSLMSAGCHLAFFSFFAVVGFYERTDPIFCRCLWCGNCSKGIGDPLCWNRAYTRLFMARVTKKIVLN